MLNIDGSIYTQTLMARACAAQSNATFLKLAGPQLVQMFIGDGAKLVRDAFALAREKAPTIIFIDELDAIGTSALHEGRSTVREVADCFCYTDVRSILMV